MKKIIGLIIVIIVIGAASIVFYKNKLLKGPLPEITENIQNQINNTLNLSGEHTINELLMMNKPMKCVWTEKATGDTEVTNTIFINGKYFYQDVTMGDMGHSYTVSDGDYLYIWNDFNDMATKIKYTETGTDMKTSEKVTEYTEVQELKRDFVCEKWPVDNSIFSPPNDKNFKDMSDEMNQVFEEMGKSEGNEESKEQICDLCRNAPSQELIDKCLENAQCN